jgi:hypothetical protein|tara:strand:+ start:102 stop:914 length:813 start_codon:yes stop_codon:yes gene_type:complete
VAVKNTEKKVSDKAFDMMRGGASKEERHLALAMAGMAPGPTGMIADLADVALYAKERDLKNMGWSALAAIPILGQVVAAKKFWKAPRILADLKLSIGKGFESDVNKGIVDLGMKGIYKKIGKTSTKVANYDISATKDGIVLNKKRLIKVVKMEDKSQGITIFQPFYQSTGRGEPLLKSKGKWFPFEGVLPSKHKVDIHSFSKEGKQLKKSYIGEDIHWAFEQGPGEMPQGWIIKGFKSPANPDRIISSGSKKEGLKIHVEIGNMLKSFKE